MATEQTTARQEGQPETAGHSRPVDPIVIQDSFPVDLCAVLDIVEQHARDCDGKAMNACASSRHSIAEYWICIEFKMQQLHDDLARRFGSPRRCPHFEFRQKLAQFKGSLSG